MTFDIHNLLHVPAGVYAESNEHNANIVNGRDTASEAHTANNANSEHDMDNAHKAYTADHEDIVNRNYSAYEDDMVIDVSETYAVCAASNAYEHDTVYRRHGAYDVSTVNGAHVINIVNSVIKMDKKVRAVEETARTLGQLGFRFVGFRQAQ